MAKVGILQIGQHQDSTPTEHVRKSAAEAMCRQLILKKIHGRLYQRIAVSAAQKVQAGRVEIQRCAYIPHEYQHHIEPKLHRVDRRQMEELERWYACVIGDSL